MVKNKLKFSIYFIITVFLTLGLSISFQSILADFTAPLNNPPTCTAGNPGCDVPINTGSTNQQKAGMLLVNTDGNANGFIVQSGKVGVGTLTPGAMLTVNGNTHIGGIADPGSWELYVTGQAYVSDYFRADGGINIGGATDPAGNLYVAGQVGIGNTSPGAYALNVTGNMFVSGQYNGGSCDIAERYNAVQEEKGELEPGDILVLDKTRKLEVKKSSVPYDKMVIGVFSTAPMFVMGSSEDSNDIDNPPVALLGRVPTKVTDENGSIKIGDLIVSSSKAGYGMKCDDYSKCQGAIVGKALEDLEVGEGLIEVLINVGM